MQDPYHTVKFNLNGPEAVESLSAAGAILTRMEPTDGPDGQTLYIDRSTGERGSEAPFYPVYVGQDGARRYGFACGNCGSLETAMDTMGRVRCGDCANSRKPDRWDAAHE